MAEANEHGARRPDPAEGVARVLAVKREILLRVHRDRLPHEDLEDCLSQAALELVTRARADGLDDDRHIANALEQKFLSRVIDRQRAIAGRSAIAAATRNAVRLDDGDDTADASFDIVALDGEPSDAATRREELERLREVVNELTDDQRLVLACQVSLGMESGEFCDRFGWSPEKFRKVAQRARARLRVLVREYELGERCKRLEGDLVAYAAQAATNEQALVVRRHLANCVGCAAFVRQLRLAGDRVGAVLPVPTLASLAAIGKGSLLAKLAAGWRALTGGSSAPAAASTGAAAGGAIAKTGAAALCVAGLVAGANHVASSRPSVQRATPRVSAARPAPAAREPSVPRNHVVIRPGGADHVRRPPTVRRRRPTVRTPRHRSHPRVPAATSPARPSATPIRSAALAPKPAFGAVRAAGPRPTRRRAAEFGVE